MRKSWPSFLLVTICALVTVAHAAPAPKGAVKLSAKDKFEADGFYCGKIKSKWIPGRIITGALFYSHAAERSNILLQAGRASGKAKKKLQSKASALKAQIDARTPTCQSRDSQPTALRFDFSNARGLALKPESSGASIAASRATASNIQKIAADGALVDAVLSGTAMVQKFLIAPNSKVYLLFSTPINLDDTSATTNLCYLAQVDSVTGVPTCIENEVTISWQSDGTGAVNKPIQFDQSGNIYYVGKNGTARILRKNVNGTITDLINENIFLDDFLVLADGTVLVSGTTTNLSAKWIRRINPAGGLKNLFTSVISKFIRIFPDNNVYIGGWDGPLLGIARYLPEEDAVDSRLWVGSIYLSGSDSNPYFDASVMCSEGANTIPGFCGFFGTSVKDIHTTSTDQVYAIAGYGGDGTLMKYYPVLERPTTLVKKISNSLMVSDKIVLSGLNDVDQNVMTLFDTEDDSEIELISATQECEVYHLSYSSEESAIYFDGLRFSDNKYIVGKYNLASMTLTMTETGGTKLQDLQVFRH